MVEFEVPGGARYGDKEMKERVIAATREHYGVEIDLDGVGLSSYYRPDGAKITKTFLSLLRRQLPRQQVQERFSGYGKEISELYTVGHSFVAEFGEKEMIGEGVYEKSATCFRSDGEHRLGKRILVANNRCKVIVLTARGRDKKDPLGRCIAYFAGNRNVFITNFYWRGITPNKSYFITAVKMLLGMKKVLYRNNPKFFLPIYRNGDAVHIYDERSTFPSPFRKMACPVCLKKVPAIQIIAGDQGNDIANVGCSAECAMNAGSKFVTCVGCGCFNPVKDSVLVAPADNLRIRTATEAQVPTEPRARPAYYCRQCYESRTTLCRICHDRSRKEEVDNDSICQRCKGNVVCCSSCKAPHYYGYGLVPVSRDSKLCRKCLSAKGKVCDVCSAYVAKTTKVVAGRITFRLCDMCKDPAPGTTLSELIDPQQSLLEAK